VVGSGVGLSRQCKLAGVARATFYDKKRRVQEKVDDAELILLGLLDAEYTRHPFYGSRRMTVWLRQDGHHINRKHVQRLMQKLGLAGMAPGPNTSLAHPEHKIYPYLLRGLPIIRPNQVWSVDITYVRLSRGFVYLVAIMDWYSRKVLSWRLSNTMDAGFCVDCLEEAIRHYGRPEIFNSDQGSQFTSDSFTKVLKDHGVTISMDGRGRAMDNIFVERLWRNVKYEDIYLNGYATMSELMLGLTKYFVFYNGERPHQALKHRTPNMVYMTAMGGGALIVDKFGGAGKEPPVPLRSTKDSLPAEATSTATAKPGQRRAAACAESTLN
jgi:putative transposase